jgi:hypothetical protein
MVVKKSRPSRSSTSKKKRPLSEYRRGVRPDIDYRKALLEIRGEDYRNSEIARWLNVSQTTVNGWINGGKEPGDSNARAIRAIYHHVFDHKFLPEKPISDSDPKG